MLQQLKDSNKSSHQSKDSNEHVPSYLRLDKPWAELEDYAKKVACKLSDVPFPVLLINQFSTWRAAHGDKLAEGKKEICEFKKQLLTNKENNAAEASKHYCQMQPSQLPAEVQKLLADPRCGSVRFDTPLFWVLMSALKLYVANEGEGLGPLAVDTVPEIDANEKLLCELRRLYTEKAQKDLQAMWAHVHHIIKCAGGSLLDGTPTEEQLKQFCSNPASLKLQEILSANRLCDGNCQFWAFERPDLLNLRASCVAYLRKQTYYEFRGSCKQMRECSKCSFFPCHPTWKEVHSWNEYCTEMAKPGTCGDIVTLHALANVLKLPTTKAVNVKSNKNCYCFAGPAWPTFITVPWVFENETLTVSLNIKQAGQLFGLFYGLRNLHAHGWAEKTLSYGIMKHPFRVSGTPKKRKRYVSGNGSGNSSHSRTLICSDGQKATSRA